MKRLIMRIGCVLAAALSLCLLNLPAAAQVSVGQQVDLNLKTIDGQTLNAKNLKGKVVVLDFWATWCGPCMQQVPHMVKLNEEYGKKGVQIIGISWDQSVGAMKPVIEQQGMKWLHVLDANRQLKQQFGVTGIPRIFVLDPDMTVRWTGHPAGMDGPLADILQKYPPVLVDPKVVSAARQTLGEVEKKLESGDAKGALKLMALIPGDASKDAEFEKAAGETRGKLDSAAQEMLKSADDDVAAGRFKEAAERLRDLSLSLNGLPVGDEAKKKLNELMSNPEAKQAVEAAQKEGQAAAAMQQPKRLRGAKKHETAYPLFKQVAKAFAGTPSGEEAAAIVKEYESDAAFMKKITDREIGGKAKAGLSLARGYAAAGRRDQAIKKYQAIIKDYPGTEYAKTAQTELVKLKK